MKDKYLPADMSGQVSGLDAYMQNNPESRVTLLYQRSRQQDDAETREVWRNNKITEITNRAAIANNLVSEITAFDPTDMFARDRIAEIREEISQIRGKSV